MFLLLLVPFFLCFVFEVEFVVVFEVFELFVFWPKAKTLHVSANTMERAMVSFFTSASLLVNFWLSTREGWRSRPDLINHGISIWRDCSHKLDEQWSCQ
jgi:hypothetical protein